MWRSLHLTITGRVQGVGYRAWFAGNARRLGLTGWVRNRRDGSVEAEIHGPSAAVERLLAASQEGPPASRPEQVLPHPITTPAPQDFQVLPTE